MKLKKLLKAMDSSAIVSIVSIESYSEDTGEEYQWFKGEVSDVPWIFMDASIDLRGDLGAIYLKLDQESPIVVIYIKEDF